MHAPARQLRFPRRPARAGITLIEMMVVVTIIALMVGVSMPSFSGGLDTLRLRTAASSVAGALNMALRTAERRQLPVELAIESSRNQLVLRVADGRREQVFGLSSGVQISRILPALYADEEKRDRYLILYPNGAPPALLIELRTQRGNARIVRLDPLTGSARIVDPTPENPDAAQ